MVQSFITAHRQAGGTELSRWGGVENVFLRYNIGQKCRMCVCVCVSAYTKFRNMWIIFGIVCVAWLYTMCLWLNAHE